MNHRSMCGGAPRELLIKWAAPPHLRFATPDPGVRPPLRFLVFETCSAFPWNVHVYFHPRCPGLVPCGGAKPLREVRVWSIGTYTGTPRTQGATINSPSIAVISCPMHMQWTGRQPMPAIVRR